MSRSPQSDERRAVHIAAVVMQAAGLCRYEDPGRQCRRVYVPTEYDCVECIEKWLLSKARKERRMEAEA